MHPIRPAVALVFAALVSGAVAHAADQACPQAKAVYGSPDRTYRLTFRPVTDKAAAISHLFTLARGNQTLDGLILESDEPVRSLARMMKDCPDGDVTGADLRACTAFEGYVYAISATGETANLGPGDGPAARHLLLAGLGPAFAASPLAAKTGLAPPLSDSFDLKECAP
nr:hypothetical protein [uncultured Gellertiella sp.]